MDVSSSRAIEPGSASLTISMNAEDMKAAFFDQTDPDEQLFYDLMSPAWEKKTISEKLTIFAKVAKLVEDSQTVKLKLTPGEPFPKNQ